MDLFKLAVVFLVLIFVIITIKRLQSGVSENSKYKQRKNVLSPAERSFYGVLSLSCADQAVVLCKVRVADILEPVKGLDKKEWRTLFNRISSKHFDYVLCKPDTFDVISVIELDDNSHKQKKRQECDQFLDSACDSASLSIYRFKASHTYSVQEIRDILFDDNVADQ